MKRRIGQSQEPKSTMKILSCCLLLLPFADMVVAATIKAGQAQKESVLSFLHDALTAATERTTPAAVTAPRNPVCSPVNERDSEDMSDAKSTESSETNRCAEPVMFDKNKDESRDESKDLDSNEITFPKVVAKNEAPSKETTRVGKDGMTVMDLTSKLVQYHGSREHGGISGDRKASRDQTDLNSEEGVIAKAQEGGRQSSSLQRWARPGRVDGMNGMLVHGQSREIPDRDSLEDNNDSLAAVGSNKQTDYDETREYVSSETYPVAPPERRPSSLSAPSKSLAA